MQEELKPPGAASGGQQGAQKAAATADSAAQAPVLGARAANDLRRAAAVVHVRRRGEARSARTQRDARVHVSDVRWHVRCGRRDNVLDVCVPCADVDDSDS